MLFVVKLTGVSLSAKSSDIRELFAGLRIADGAIHIVGGREESAFVVFTRPEDAQQGVLYSHTEIHGHQVQVAWSTRKKFFSS